MPCRSALLVLTLSMLVSHTLRAQKPNPTETYEGVTFVAIRPYETDPGITTFNDPHWAYNNLNITVAHDGGMPADRHQLLLWIPGTRPRNAPLGGFSQLTRGNSHTFCLFAATLGYHVIALSYPNTISTSACNKDPNPAAFSEFRRVIIAGGATRQINVSTEDCIQNRLIKLLMKLAWRFPGEGWETFLNPDGTLPWEKIAVAGQSQGAGHAAFIAVRRKVARVVCIGGPKDYSSALQKPAAWYAETSATPKELFFAFNHYQDHQGCTAEHQMENLKALGLEQFGAPADVDSTADPFQNSHVLMTNYPGSKVSSETAHGEMIDPANSLRFGDVWRYMLTK